MRTIFQSLAWKEWHEHKWKLLALVTIMFGVAAVPLIELDRSTLIGIVMGLCLGVVPLAVFVGLGTAAGEQSRGTMPFLQSLPVPMWRVALHKVFFGAATIIVPALLTLLFVAAVGIGLERFGAERRHVSFGSIERGLGEPVFLTTDLFVDGCFIAVAMAMSFYAWTIAFGVNRKDEVSAGAVALAFIVGWMLVVTTSFNFLVDEYGSIEKWTSVPGRTLAMFAIAVTPGGIITVPNIRVAGQGLAPFAFAVAAITQIALLFSYVLRFGRTDGSERRSLKGDDAAATSSWLGPPRYSPTTAIAWKQFRESGAIALVGLALVVIVFVLTTVGSGFRQETGGVFLRVIMSVGFGLAIVMGIGVMLRDVEPGVNTFWRSRPVNPDQWFWMKYLSGLAVLVAAIYAPIFALLLGNFELDIPFGRPSELLMFPAIQTALFAAAVAMTCLVRQAVYAAILSVAWMYLWLMATALVFTAGKLVGLVARTTDDLVGMNDQQIVVGIVVSFIASTVLAWLATRNDWGQKRPS